MARRTSAARSPGAKVRTPPPTRGCGGRRRSSAAAGSHVTSRASTARARSARSPARPATASTSRSTCPRPWSCAAAHCHSTPTRLRRATEAASRPARRACGARRPRSARRSAHTDEVHDEHQRLVGADDSAGTALAIGQLRRERDLAPAAPPHPRHALVPAGDDLALAELELERVPAVPGGVELLARPPRDADVVNLDHPARGRLVALADDDVVELELVGGRSVGGDVDPGLLVGRHGGERYPRSPAGRDRAYRAGPTATTRGRTTQMDYK